MENILKEKLKTYLTQDFQILENISGINFYKKGVRPDLVLKLKNTHHLVVIEIKDDTLTNFSLAELLRQAVSYKFAHFQNEIPLISLITTTNLLKNPSHNFEKEEPMFQLANKLGVGKLYVTGDKNNRILKMGIGSNVFYKYYFSSGDSEFNFDKIPKLIIGTNSNENRVENS